MCQSYTGSGVIVGNNHSFSSHKAYSGKHLPVAQTPFHIPDSISHSGIANFYKPVDVFFTFLQEETQCSIFFSHEQKCPSSVCGLKLFRYMYIRMNLLLEAVFLAVVNLQNKRKHS